MKSLNVFIVDKTPLLYNMFKKFQEELNLKISLVSFSRLKTLINKRSIDIVILNRVSSDCYTNAKYLKDRAIKFIIVNNSFKRDDLEKIASLKPISCINQPIKKSDFEFAILLAKNILSLHKNQIRLKDNLIYDLDTKTLYKDYKPIKLTQKRWAVIDILVKANGQIISNDILEDILWSNQIISSSTLRTFIYRLNKYIGYSLIQKVHSYGYKISLEPEFDVIS